MVHAILVAALFPFRALPAQQEPAAANVQTFAELARQFSAELEKQHVKRIVIMDFEDPNRKVTPFGAWLAEQLSSAPGNPWAPVDTKTTEVPSQHFRLFLTIQGHSGNPRTRQPRSVVC